MISYRKLWIYLRRRNIKKIRLLDVISAPTLAKLGKNENVNTDTILKVCKYLRCQPEDIMEVILYDK
ncbi:MAG: helix-turn-helix transcriptional regulator [Lachnospiraceae bacterium]|nr:helix-turn-helix transcriptional regulator [Lachnospiraceae bacterium]